MASRVKKRGTTATNRESDRIIVRLPDGMRERLAKMAASRGRSMTSEVIAALENHLKIDFDLLEALGDFERRIERLESTVNEINEEGRRGP
jgi:predicted DNA-binding protein